MPEAALAIYGAGLVLGLGLITPIGPQNVFVIGQGLAAGVPRALLAVCAAGGCDTLLIVVGWLGAANVLAHAPALRLILLSLGAVYLSYLGIRALRSTGTRLRSDEPQRALSPRGVLVRTTGVSLLNPHAVLDTVGVIGAAVAAQRADARGTFALGTISASWLWFLFLAAGAASFRRYMTPQRARLFDRFSGTVMLIFACFLAAELARSLI